MKKRLSLKTLTLAVLVSATTGATRPTTQPYNRAPTVKVSGGMIRGLLTEGGGAAFKGIPYAQPPVGDLRWREPVPTRAWTEGQERGPNGRARNPGLPGWCDTPVADRKAEEGCSTTAITEVGVLPREPLYWHLDTFPDRAAAEAQRGPRGTVVNGHGKHWLFTIAEETWRAGGGNRAATIGPLVVDSNVPYTARYLETVIRAGFQDGNGDPGHRHPGPEVWFLLARGQCLETPNGVMSAQAGQSMLAPEGWPMAISSLGPDTRRALVLVLHRTSERYVMPVDATPHAPHAHWRPQGLCANSQGTALASQVAKAPEALRGCDRPTSERKTETGCYTTAETPLGVLPAGPMFWHLYTYPSRAAAEAARGPRGTVTESFGKHWLFTIAEESWRPVGGDGSRPSGRS